VYADFELQHRHRCANPLSRMLPTRRAMGLFSKLTGHAPETSSAPSTVYSAQNRPAYIYKILPHHSVQPRYAFPIPIPASHEFALSELDAKVVLPLPLARPSRAPADGQSEPPHCWQDGFLHFSTASQLEGTLSRFFADQPAVTLLKCDYARLSGWKVIKWEQAGSGGGASRSFTTTKLQGGS
jgi:uncharacterized protein (DUF952 family)